MSSQKISMFIDDELTLDDKIDFVETIHDSKEFKEETVELLHQEQLLRSDPVDCYPAVEIKSKRFFPFRFLRPLGLVSAGAVLALLVMVLTFTPTKAPDIPYRFILYRPDVSRVDITGSFTGWKAVPMKQTGSSGYWEYTSTLPRGEHRFAYLLNGTVRVPDPTIQTREGDDFGSENTILSIGGTAL
ncbi:MAG: glycogen-binding domain-containing protein [Syntrophales bacterium LBB04]|nr:glycogen-binding domain-containing protein [Syntrophales bacterium LBB04]